MMNKLRELLLLNSIKGFGKVKINKCLDMVRDAKDFDHLVTLIEENTNVDESALLSAMEASQKAYDSLIMQEDMKIVTVFDPEYPKGFLSLDLKKPVILYAKGDVSVLNKPGVSVVGTRKPSLWSQRLGKSISKRMCLMTDSIIVSGLALGCDRFAHEGALSAGAPTVAILPSGVNVITPSSHKKLAEEIIEKGGCLISEYKPDAKAQKNTYVERDSLIAAMTDITYVIECAEKSGTMHTVNEAYNLGRKLACYYPDQDALDNGARESDYSGNKKMINEMGAMAIANKDDLRILFKSLYMSEEDSTVTDKDLSEKATKEPRQISITDYLGSDV